MGNRTISRADLVGALSEEVGLSRKECAELLDGVLGEIADRLAEDRPVKIYRFARFSVRRKKERIGRNPKTGEKALIRARKVVVFRPSLKLKHWINHPEDLPRWPRRQMDLFES